MSWNVNVTEIKRDELGKRPESSARRIRIDRMVLPSLGKLKIPLQFE